MISSLLYSSYITLEVFNCHIDIVWADTDINFVHYVGQIILKNVVTRLNIFSPVCPSNIGIAIAWISNGFRSVQTRYRPTTRPKIEFHGSVGIGLAGTDHRVGTKAVIPRYRSVRVHSKLIPSWSHRSLIFKYPTGYRSCQWWCRYSRHYYVHI